MSPFAAGDTRAAETVRSTPASGSPRRMSPSRFVSIPSLRPSVRSIRPSRRSIRRIFPIRPPS